MPKRNVSGIRGTVLVLLFKNGIKFATRFVGFWLDPIKSCAENKSFFCCAEINLSHFLRLEGKVIEIEKF